MLVKTKTTQYVQIKIKTHKHWVASQEGLV